MHVTINQRQEEVQHLKYHHSRGFFGKVKTRTIPEPKTIYVVELLLQLTEEEKAIVNQYNLGEVVVDQLPPRVPEEELSRSMLK